MDYVDLYLIHSPERTNGREQWPVMEELVKEGKTRSIGVSNFRVKDLKEVLEVAKVRTTMDCIIISKALGDFLS